MPVPDHLRQVSETCIAPDDLRPDALCGRGPTVAHSLCTKHAKRLQRNGDTHLRRAPNGSKTSCCHPDGCERPRRSASGWCHMHLTRVTKSPTGDPGPVGPLPRGVERPPCIDCGKGPGIRKDRCSGCYNRARNTLSPAELRALGMDASECSEDDCARTAVAKGRCRRHYRAPSEISRAA